MIQNQHKAAEEHVLHLTINGVTADRPSKLMTSRAKSGGGDGYRSLKLISQLTQRRENF